MKTGIIVEPSVWLYGENFTEITDELLMGWAVGILEEASGWCKVVTHYGYVGYLKRNAIRFCLKEELERRDGRGQTVFISRGFADVLEAPKVQGRILMTLSRGAFATVCAEHQNGYRKIQLADDTVGYIPCIAYECRRDSDGYLYAEDPADYFIKQVDWQPWQENMLRERLVCYAKRYFGTQYRWGGKTPLGMDCSGLTFMSYLMSGILIYRDAKLKEGYPVHEISRKEMKKGDLLYFPGHIAMYIGDCRYIHSTGNLHSFGCVINSLSQEDWNYRKDLAESLYAVGSVFE